ncbi:glycosyltransferase [Meiothermus sp. CFH 77666]|uniref:glycosyltransferase family 4 protein n=1 Tax=Meiothermus sp. CFH 77666 TaxID=2817942 RepID=UPI001AA06CF3|nr:glycosyltransferase [Meiothermus sp. CFH 77666]MBO1436009.1 glycosyltransferase [Meiothermus sp. CFH 77666]
MRAVVRNAAAILATNHETRRLLEAANAKNVMLMNVTGLRDDYVPDEPPPPPQNTELQLLWAGRLEAFKGLDLALEALKLVADLPVQLLVAGEGPMREAWENKVSRLGLDGKVSFLGQMSWHEIKKQYASADAFVFTSLRDSFGSVVLEAMAHGKPILTLNHQGVGCFVPDDAGFKVTVESPQATVRALADGIRQLQANPHLRQQMGRAAHRYALSERQSLRTEFILGLYRQLLSKRDHARFA